MFSSYCAVGANLVFALAFDRSKPLAFESASAVACGFANRTAFKFPSETAVSDIPTTGEDKLRPYAERANARFRALLI
jgi:hypothetical protein